VEQAAMVVQVDALEVAADEHATHDVAPATEGHPASHPLLARLSLLNLLTAHATAVHVSLSEHVSQVPLATVGQPTSHPLLKFPSSLNLLASQVKAVHVSLSEHVSQVPSSTVGQPTSHPSVASLLVLNLLAEQAAMVVQVDALEVAADEHATHDVAPATEGHPASHKLLV